jgi:hypothetical protein
MRPIPDETNVGVFIIKNLLHLAICDGLISMNEPKLSPFIIWQIGTNGKRL